MSIKISHAPLEYQRFKAIREQPVWKRTRPLSGQPRYELKSSLTTRRVDRKDNLRKYD